MALREKLLDGQIFWPPGQESCFIPVDALNSILTYEAVKEELRIIDSSKDDKQLSSYAHYIRNNAKKIFAMLLIGNKRESVFSFIDEHICDNDLPFKKAGVFGNSQDPLRLCKQTNTTGCEGIRSMSKWTRHEIREFCRIQWQVQAPVFQKTESGIVPHYDLDDNVILPFIEDNEREMASGGYSHVWKVRIHPAHQNLWIPVGDYVSTRPS